MTTKREILLGELEAWHAEGALDEASYQFLSSRYRAAPRSAELDSPLLAPDGPRAAPAHKGSFAADAMQFVGGLLVGAALVALVLFLKVTGPSQEWAMFGLGFVLVALGAIAAVRDAPMGLVEAALAGGLVPMAVGGGLAIGQHDLTVPGLVAACAVGIVVLRRGVGASTVVAGAAFSWAMAAATLLQQDFLFGGGSQDPAPRWVWMISLLGFTALLLVWRKRRFWIAVSLALIVIPLALAAASILDLVNGLTSEGAELTMGAFLGALLGIGIFLGSRGLVTGAAAGLVIDAVVFAFDVGGPGTAVVLLLALGGLLVWQAELVRRYFRDEGATDAP